MLSGLSRFVLYCYHPIANLINVLLDKCGIDLNRLSRLESYALSLFAIHKIDRMILLDTAWWPYKVQEAVEMFIVSREHKPIRVFEWGAGSSTFWLSKRGCDCVSIEHDKFFFTVLKSEQARLNRAFSLLLVEPDGPKSEVEIVSNKTGYQNYDFISYVDAISAFEKFDLIVIDGRSRDACLEKAILHLKDDGLILFDNSERKRYAPSIEKFAPYKKTIRGLTPASPWPTSSTLIAKNQSMLNSLLE